MCPLEWMNISCSNSADGEESLHRSRHHLNNRILLFVCNRKILYYYCITLPSITITITLGNFQSITITITGKSGYYILQLHITITPSLLDRAFFKDFLLVGQFMEEGRSCPTSCPCPTSFPNFCPTSLYVKKCPGLGHPCPTSFPNFW